MKNALELMFIKQYTEFERNSWTHKLNVCGDTKLWWVVNITMNTLKTKLNFLSEIMYIFNNIHFFVMKI